jgi:hypothetical protein
VKITNNLGAFNYDDVTTNGNDDAISTVLIPQDTTSNTDPIMIPFDEPSVYAVTKNLVSPVSVSTFCPTTALSSLSLPNHIYDIKEEGLYIDDTEPITLPPMENSSIPFLHDDDSDDASIFAGLDNTDDDDMDGSSIVAVDELLSLDRILGFDSTDFEVDQEWL